MIAWYHVVGVLVLLVLMVTFFIATSREAYCELMAAVFAILCTPVLIFLGTILYLISFIS
jgi:hypothetical protein